MKASFFVISLMAALVCAGCKSQTVNTVGPEITQLAVAAFAGYEISQHPEARPYLTAATPIVCSLATTGTVDPNAIANALDNSGLGGLKTPTATIIINGVLGIYETVYASYGTNIQTSVIQPYLIATCNGLEAALPSPTPATVAAMTPAAKRAALYPPKWAWVK